MRSVVAWEFIPSTVHWAICTARVQQGLLNPMKLSRARVWPNKNLSIAERPARRSVSVEMSFYCYRNNASRSRVSVRSTFSNCHVLFRYLPHSFVHVSLRYWLNYQTASQWCRACHQQISKQPTLLMSSGR